MSNNYVVDEGGSTFIAATQRPDGSWRKPRKIKDGYIPQEEVPLYESKGKIIEKGQPMYPVGLSEEYIKEAQQRREAEVKKQNKQHISGTTAATNSKKKKKKSGSESVKPPPAEDLLQSSSYSLTEPTRVKDDQWTTVGGRSKITITAKMEQKRVPQSGEKLKPVVKTPQPPTQEKVNTEAMDPTKRVKNLRKRLKEMEQIEDKKASGVKLEKEQIEKLSRRDEVEEEIARLLEEFDLS